MRILMLSNGGNPAMDMVYCGLRELGLDVIEYPVIDYRHSTGLALSASGFPPHEISDYWTILKMAKENAFDLLIADKFDNRVDEKFTRLIDACKCKFAIIDQTGVNLPTKRDFWDEPPYRGRLPEICYVRTKPRETSEVRQETLLMSVRRNWAGPLFDEQKTKYLSVFLGIIYPNFHDARYRRVLVHDVFEDFPDAFFSRNMKFYGEEYYNLLAKSLTAVNVKGMCWDSWRFWEILQVGSCLISEDTTEVIDYNPPFVDAEHFLKFRFKFDYSSGLPSHVAQELIDVLTFARDNADEVEKIARRGHAFALECHSDVNRAKQVLKILE